MACRKAPVEETTGKMKEAYKKGAAQTTGIT
jgi:hypothetical protein